MSHFGLLSYCSQRLEGPIQLLRRLEDPLIHRNCRSAFSLILDLALLRLSSNLL